MTKSPYERRADSADRLATGLALAALVANVPLWGRVFLLALAMITYAMSEGFVAMGREVER